MTLPYLVAGGVVAVVLAGGSGYFFGKDVQRDRDAVEMQRVREEATAASRADERLLATQQGQIGLALTTALNAGDDRAAPQVRIIHDALRTSPLATNADCRVPDSVRVAVASLYADANRAAAAADRAGAAADRREGDRAVER